MRKSSHSQGRPSPTKTEEVFVGDQGDLFHQLLAEPMRLDAQHVNDMDVSLEFMGAIAQALKEARSRRLYAEQVLDRMNRALPDNQKPVTLRQFYAWTAKSKEFHPMPCWVLPAFCWATGSDAPLRVLAGTLGYDLIDERELRAMELGKTQVELARLRRRASTLTRHLGGRP